MSKRILVAGHDAFRAGAQIVLLQVLEWLRAHHPADLSLLLSGGGELLADYEAVLPTVVTTVPGAPPPTAATSVLASRVRRLLRRPATRIAPVPLDDLGIDPGRIDLLYVNSLATSPLATAIAAAVRGPAVCHVHELEARIRHLASPPRLQAALAVFDHYIAVSRPVADNLVANHGIDAARIDVIPPCVPIPTGRPDPGRVATRRASLGIPDDAFVVGGCGTVDWRKGTDLFPLIAKAAVDRAGGRPLHFVWVGGTPAEHGPVLHDRDRLGLTSVVHLVPHQADPGPYFEVFDTFLLPSREDPFPLVCLEAAATGVPIVCFADAGGMPELVDDDAGYVVPYLDLDGAADRLCALARSPETAEALGSRAAEKVAERCSVEVVGPRIAAVLDRYLL